MFQKGTLEIRCCNLFFNKEFADYIHSLGGIFRIILSLNEATKLNQPFFLPGGLLYFSVVRMSELYFENPPADLS